MSIAIVACWIAVWIEMVMSIKATDYRVGVFNFLALQHHRKNIHLFKPTGVLNLSKFMNT